MTFTVTKEEIQLKNELNFIKNCINDLKKIKKWTHEEKKMFYELLNKKKSLEVKLIGLIK